VFSYRHAFHAGNHADVLKHAMFVHILDYFGRKPAPYWVIDTHAGAGLYGLQGEASTKTAEAADGIGRLWDGLSLPPLIQRYLQALAEFNPTGALKVYPGSPWWTLKYMRAADRLRLFEWHPTEAEVLAGNLGQLARAVQRRVMLYHADGFQGLNALLPPPTRRGMVIIDPSYEDKQDYRRTVLALKAGLQRFATGTFIAWYPLVQRRESSAIGRQLEHLPIKHWVHATLSVRQPAANGLGLHGSGMFVVNPPYTLHGELQAALPWLVSQLNQDPRACYTLSQQTD
jgi:23S rRNA (adenine2030-N6)-methyltransferase